MKRFLKNFTQCNLEISSTDIKYKIYTAKTNKEIERSENIIIVGIKERLSLLKNNNINEFFIDIMFMIIPKIYRPFKAMTIATIDKKNKKIY